MSQPMLRLAPALLVALLFCPPQASAQNADATVEEWHAGIEALYDAGEIDAALAATDLLRSFRMRALLDLHGIDPVAGLPPELAADLKTSDEHWIQLTHELLLCPDAPRAKSLLGDIEEALAARPDVEGGADARPPRDGYPGREARLYTGTAIADLLPGDAAALVFSDCGDRLLIFGVAPDGTVAAADVSLDDAFRARIDALRADPTDESAAEHLSSVLLEPVAQVLAASSGLVVAPDACVFGAPFAALRTPSGSVLGGALPVSYVVSFAQLELAIRNAKPQRPDTACVLYDPEMPSMDPNAKDRYAYVPPSGSRGGDAESDDERAGFVYVPITRGGDAIGPLGYAYVPESGTRGGDGNAGQEGEPETVATMRGYFGSRGLGLPRLGDTAFEASSVAEALTPATVKRIQGLLASETAARKALADYGAVHLATFAVADDRIPLFSSVVLSPDPTNDGFLAAYELVDLPVAASLVGISVAAAPPDAPQTGDGLSALVWCLTLAGAPDVLVTTSRSKDGDGGLYLRIFYSARSGGSTNAEASQSAILASRDAGETTYWSGYRLYGCP